MSSHVRTPGLPVLLAILTALAQPAVVAAPLIQSALLQAPASHTAIEIASALHADPERFLSEAPVWMIEGDDQP